MDTSTRNDHLNLQAWTLQTWVGDCTEGLGQLLLEYAEPGEALRAPVRRLEQLPPRTRAALHKARRHWPRRNSQAPANHQLAQNCYFLPIADERYPERLRTIPDPPPWLFCRGDYRHLQRPAIAIVGTRRASRAGLQAANDIARRLAGGGYAICSGLALGIDAAAHRGALGTGVTLAILASGIDCPSPRQHHNLAQQIAAQGCLLSELPIGTQPARYRFPRRNRIISGIASATIIVEAALPSGSLHTATAALEQGRDVLVLPWSVYHTGGAGGLRLLRDGATPITSLDELDTYFPGLPDTPGRPRSLPAGDAGEILALLGDEALSADELLAGLPMDPGPLLVVLGELEVGGWLVREDGRYRRCSSGSL